MFPHESLLIKKINTVLKNNLLKNELGLTGLRAESETKLCSRQTNRGKHEIFLKKTNSREKLQARIAALEEVNRCLLHFISIIIINPSDVLANHLLTTPAGCETINQKEEMIDFILKKENQKKSPPRPTKREKDVLDLLIKGYCAKEIAKQLFISETTVITHKKNLKEKFNAKNTVELISKTAPFSDK